MELALTYAPTTCALIPYITLSEAGAAFTTRAINFRARDNMKPDYLALNPMHKVPVLVIDGRPLTENVAIQVWIARAFPKARLLPADPMEEIKAISTMAWCASSIHPHLSRFNSPSKFCACDAPGSEAATRAIATEQLLEAYAIAENRLADREYFFDHFTAADAYFFWCWRKAIQFDLPRDKLRACQAHFELLSQRPSVRTALAFDMETQAAFAQAA